MSTLVKPVIFIYRFSLLCISYEFYLVTFYEFKLINSFASCIYLTKYVNNVFFLLWKCFFKEGTSLIISQLFIIKGYIFMLFNNIDLLFFIVFVFQLSVAFCSVSCTCLNFIAFSSFFIFNINLLYLAYRSNMVPFHFYYCCCVLPFIHPWHLIPFVIVCSRSPCNQKK